MTKIYKAALYGRLSREDGDNLESESITNQRDYMRNYVKKQKDMVLVEEYFDDGYTGGNFHRPSWEKLIEDIKSKKIDTIITKDLSRMGRDYITMGEYIERIFPEKQIRYIAINDDIDTLYETPGLDYLQFKLMFNDFYIKDGSKKIRKILKGKKEQGQYTGWKGIYGYKRDPNDKHKLIVDEEVRDIVVRMFDLAKQGYGPKYIANLFSLEGIPNPSMHANRISSNKKGTSSMWCERTVGELLKNPTYVGHLTQGIRKKVSYKSSKEIRVPKENWIVVKNTHEPIIDEETFHTVQELLKKNKNNTQNGKKYLLRGFLYCKECGHSVGINISADKKRKYCVCNYYQAHSKFRVCTPHSMNYNKLEDSVLKELKAILQNYLDKDTLKNMIIKNISKVDLNDRIKRKIKSLESKIKQATIYLDQIYMDMLKNNIDLAQYNRLKYKIKDDLVKLNVQKKEYEVKLHKIESNPHLNKDKEILCQLENIIALNNPSRELLVQLIDQITISEDKTIEIKYKFKLP